MREVTVESAVEDGDYKDVNLASKDHPCNSYFSFETQLLTALSCLHQRLRKEEANVYPIPLLVDGHR